MKEGVTVIVEKIGAFVLFVETKEAMSPVPDAAKPVAILSLDHVYTVPATLSGLVKFTDVEVPAHTT